MKETIKNLKKKVNDLIDKVPDEDYINVNTIKFLCAAILDLSHANNVIRERK